MHSEDWLLKKKEVSGNWETGWAMDHVPTGHEQLPIEDRIYLRKPLGGMQTKALLWSLYFK
jgi:hypothetical protein